MFIVWNGAILGSIDQAPGSGQKVDPLSLLTQSSGPAGLLIQVKTSTRQAGFFPQSYRRRSHAPTLTMKLPAGLQFVRHCDLLHRICLGTD